MSNGEAISLVCIDEHQYLKDIERLLKQEIVKVVIPNFQPDPSIKAQPSLSWSTNGAKKQAKTSLWTSA